MWKDESQSQMKQNYKADVAEIMLKLHIITNVTAAAAAESTVTHSWSVISDESGEKINFDEIWLKSYNSSHNDNSK